MLKASDELRLCADAHETAVITEDEYRIEELYGLDKDIEYIADLGANIGSASAQFQKFFPNAKILVCEPEPELMKYTKLNTDNKLIYVEEAIIGDDRKEVTFNICKWQGNHHVDGNFRWDLFAPMGSKKIGEIKVKASTLKDIMDRYEFPRIDLIKLDTEGMEGQILRAFKPYMDKIKHIRGEWHGDVDREIIREALKDTHEIFFDRKLTTHGGIFAVRKDIPVKTIEYNGYKVIKRIGLPDIVQTI